MATPSTRDVRIWAKSEGLDVSDRGRISAEVVAAYQKATAVAAPPAKRTGAAKAAPARPAKAPAPHPPVAEPAAPVVIPAEVEKRVDKLESQVAWLIERLDAVAVAMAKPAKPSKPAKPFSLSRRR